MQSMSEWMSRQTKYSRIMEEQRPKGKRFYVIETGGCDMAHRELVNRLENNGQTEVNSDTMCDYYLVFCPTTSRIATDIGEAERHIPDDKPVILVVMHHTHNRNAVIVESSRHTTKPNIKLTVDCLFYKNRLLDCNHNELAWHQIKKFLGVTETPCWKKYLCNRWCVLTVSAVIVGASVATAVYYALYKH